MKQCVGAVVPSPLVLLLLSECLAWSQSIQQRQPIIDMHLHAHTLSMYGAPPPAVCTNDQEIVFPAWDPRQPLTLARVLKACPAPLNAPSTDEELLAEMLAMLKRYDIRAVTTGSLEQVTKWRAAAPDRIIPAVPFDDHEPRDPQEFRSPVQRRQVRRICRD